MKAFVLTVLRMIKSNILRLIAVTAIIALGLAFISGLGAIPPNILASTNDYYNSHSVPDLIVKTKSMFGFNATQKQLLSDSQSQISVSLAFTSYDLELDNDDVARLYFLPLSEMPLNKIELIEGVMPTSSTQVLAERESNYLHKNQIGDTVEVNGQILEITGIAANPLFLSLDGEPSNFDDKDLDIVLYFDSDIAASPPITTDIYLQIEGAAEYTFHSNKYKDLVDDTILQLKQLCDNDENLVFLTLRENKSAAMLETNADKIQIIAYFFPIFFVTVSALVALITMTRLVEEERLLIGCYRSIGYSKFKIALKYIVFAFICCTIGSVAGVFLGNAIVMPTIYQAFEFAFHIPPAIGTFYLNLGAVTAAIITAAVLAITLYIALKLLKEKPAELLRQKAPIAGKKIFLEKIPLIWKRLKFKYKSSFRNIFRHIRQFLMTVVCVAGSAALLMAGFALYDVSHSADNSDLGGVLKSIDSIALIVIFCAAILTVLVMYNLTNMNIDERKREIATLRVLGYKNTEVAGYIFRELFILSIIGIIFGLPLGCGFVHVVFTYMDFGSINNIRWYSFVLTSILCLFFIFITDLLLYRKITKVDMNGSLKTVE